MRNVQVYFAITEWDNPYFEVKEPDQMAFSIKINMSAYRPVRRAMIIPFLMRITG